MTQELPKGFTLIELVIVIVILAVFALPRFADLGADGRVATLHALEGSMRSASGIANSVAIVGNKLDCQTDYTVEMEGESVTMRCGYPCPHPNGIDKAVDASGNYTFVGGNCTGVLGSVDAQITDAPDPANCKINYTSARQNRQPGITLTTSGC